MVHIDLSDNDDAGFYAAGSRYQVRLEGITVDGATLNVWIGAFSVGCTLRPTTAGRTLSVHVTGDVEADMVKVSGSAGALLALDEYWSGIYAEAGTAQAGDTQSITLASGNSAEDDFYKNDFIYLVNGTGTGQCRRIVSYTGSTRVATITSSWAINPSTDTVYLIIPGAGANAEWIAGTPIGGSGTEGDPWGPV